MQTADFQTMHPSSAETNSSCLSENSKESGFADSSKPYNEMRIYKFILYKDNYQRYKEVK